LYDKFRPLSKSDRPRNRHRDKDESKEPEAALSRQKSGTDPA
jgi:hypothetical protein